MTELLQNLNTDYLLVFLVGMLIGMVVWALIGDIGPEEDAVDTEGMGLLTLRDVGDDK